MDGADKLSERVTGWLRDQGYPFEMRTARELRRKGIAAHLGQYYTDIETGQQRETDVCAFVERREDHGLRGRSVCGHLVIECKSARDKPWILFTDEQRSRFRRAYADQRFAIPNNKWLSPVGKQTWKAGPVPLLEGYRPFGYTLVRAFGNGNDDVAYGAVMSVAKAAAGLRNKYAADADTLGVAIRAVVLPVLLVDAPLFQCELDDEGQERLTSIDRGTLVWRYQLGPDLPKETLVSVVTTSALSALADDLKLTVDSLRRAERDPSSVVLGRS
ncbi:hypothetical protein [Nocardia tengchongensis]|uniref:hypothetical protein n=1 Tax=Nocardia tengchongensis TaxID=2055889 RepID=UPI003650EE05